jgi:hypothetical protein
MAPKARPRVQITGHAGAPQITRDGAAVKVSKRLTGASVIETFPRSRIRGKTKQGEQLIPAHDVLQVLQTEATATAAKSFADAERRMAAGIVEERQRQLADISQQRERERRREGMRQRMKDRVRHDTAVAKLARKRKRAREAREARAARAPGTPPDAIAERQAKTVAEHRRRFQESKARRAAGKAGPSRPEPPRRSAEERLRFELGI